MDLKKGVIKEFDEYSPSHTIIASNASGLSLTEMASGIRRQGQTVIAHWWNPPHIIPVVEVVKGRYTSDETVELLYQPHVHWKTTGEDIEGSPGFLRKSTPVCPLP